MARAIYTNPNRIRYKFTDKEMAHLWKVAEVRQSPKENNTHARDKRRVLLPNVEMHLIGLLGEYAFSKFVGVEMDENGYLGGDIEKDFLIDGNKIEIKTLQGYLVFDVQNFDAEFCADIAVLAIFNRDPGDRTILHNVSLEGWITKEEFINKRFIDDFGYGPRYCVQPDVLNAMDELPGLHKPLRVIQAQFAWNA